MRFNVNRPPKHVREEQERMARQEWHKKFAWKATKVDHTDIGHRVVWFENYWRKEKIGPTNSMEDDGRYFEKYSEKEYFKKQLNGDFDNYGIEEDEVDASAIVNQIKNQMNKHPGNAGMHKKGGPSSGVKFKKYIVGESPPEPNERYYVDRDVDGVIESIKSFYEDEDDYEG